MRSFASVLIALRCASEESHVQPISAASGGSGGFLADPSGHVQYSRLPKRVEPTTRPPSRRTVANGTAAPASRAVSAASTYRRIAASPSGTQVNRYVSRETLAAATSAGT